MTGSANLVSTPVPNPQSASSEISWLTMLCEVQTEVFQNTASQLLASNYHLWESTNLVINSTPDLDQQSVCSMRESNNNVLRKAYDSDRRRMVNFRLETPLQIVMKQAFSICHTEPHEGILSLIAQLSMVIPYNNPSLELWTY